MIQCCVRVQAGLGIAVHAMAREVVQLPPLHKRALLHHCGFFVLCPLHPRSKELLVGEQVPLIGPHSRADDAVSWRRLVQLVLQRAVEAWRLLDKFV